MVMNRTGKLIRTVVHPAPPVSTNYESDDDDDDDDDSDWASVGSSDSDGEIEVEEVRLEEE